MEEKTIHNRPNVNKIPGDGLPLASKENHVKDITKLTQTELLDMKQRQENLLASKSCLAFLADKGKRLQDLYAKILAELERRADVDETAGLLSALNIGSKGQKILNKLEWCGSLNEDDLRGVEDVADDVLDSDDDAEIDPLRIIAQERYKKLVKILPPEPQLITAQDLEEIKSFTHDSTDSIDSGVSTEAVGVETDINAEIISMDVGANLPNLKRHLQEIAQKTATDTNSDIKHSKDAAEEEMEPHMRYLVDKELLSKPGREKYKPYQTTISNVHDPAKERARKQGKHWEVTAATPNPIRSNGVQMISLLDSVEVQKAYMQKVKEEEEKRAAHRLAAKIERLKMKNMDLPPEEILKTKASFTQYRAPRNHSVIEGCSKNDEFPEVYDPLDEERHGSNVSYRTYKYD